MKNNYLNQISVLSIRARVAPPSEKNLGNLTGAITKNMIQYGTNKTVSPLIDSLPNPANTDLPVEKALLPKTIPK